MNATTVILLLLLLACPLSMIFMHRGGHSHGGSASRDVGDEGHAHGAPPAPTEDTPAHQHGTGGHGGHGGCGHGGHRSSADEPAQDHREKEHAH